MFRPFIFILYFSLCFLSSNFNDASSDFCSATDKDSCDSPPAAGSRMYIFYDVNRPEGFNLRRDVYMRLAVFVHKLVQNGADAVLVLPPWDNLRHWRSEDDEVGGIAWEHFFDVESMKRFVPVVELRDALEETSPPLDEVWYLQHYKDAFSSENWDWSDKWSFEACNDIEGYTQTSNGVKGRFWGYNITAATIKCLSYQGGASLLNDIFREHPLSQVMLEHAEVLLHDDFGGVHYWKCRRSMRFSRRLIDEAIDFMRTRLNYDDFASSLVIYEKWEDQRDVQRQPKGGSYLCGHLRRNDFLYGRAHEIPSLDSAARQIIDLLNRLNLTGVFISTDAPSKEKETLRAILRDFTVIFYSPDAAARLKFKDGGIAIIDQIICSYARHFVGSHESTFSFRIQEEREIMGFPVESTFNRFCADSQMGGCEQPSKWKIVF